MAIILSKSMSWLKGLFADEAGATAIEFGLITALIAVWSTIRTIVVCVAIVTLGRSLT